MHSARLAGVERRRTSLRGRSPGYTLVDAAVELMLDSVEEAGDQLVVVLRSELLAGRQGHLELAFRRWVDAPKSRRRAA